MAGTRYEYEVVITTVVKDDTHPGASATNSSVRKMAEQTARDMAKSAIDQSRAVTQLLTDVQKIYQRIETSATKTFEKLASLADQSARSQEAAADRMAKSIARAYDQVNREAERSSKAKTVADERAAREVERIRAQTLKQADQNEKIRAQAAKVLADVQVKEAQRAADALIDSLKGVEQQSHESGSAFGGIFSAVFFANIAERAIESVTSKIKSLATDSVMTAARTQELGFSLNALGKANGISAQEINKQESALRGANIAMQESRQVLAQLIASGIEGSAAQKLAKVAKDLAVVAGVSSSTEIQQLTNAIQTQNSELFRSAGVYIVIDQELSKYAKTIGKSQNDLTALEKQQALVNATVAYGTKVAGTYDAAMGSASKQIRSLERVQQDLESTIGSVFLPILSALVLALYEVGNWFSKHETVVKSLTLLVTIAVIAFTAWNAQLIVAGVRAAFVSVVLPRLQSAFSAVTVSANEAGAATLFFGNALKVTGVLAIVAALGALIYTIYQSTKATDELTVITDKEVDSTKKQIISLQEQSTWLRNLNDKTSAYGESQTRLKDIQADMNTESRIRVELLAKEVGLNQALATETDKLVEKQKKELQSRILLTGEAFLQAQKEQELQDSVHEASRERLSTIRTQGWDWSMAPFGIEESTQKSNFESSGKESAKQFQIQIDNAKVFLEIEKKFKIPLEEQLKSFHLQGEALQHNVDLIRLWARTMPELTSEIKVTSDALKEMKLPDANLGFFASDTSALDQALEEKLGEIFKRIEDRRKRTQELIDNARKQQGEEAAKMIPVPSSRDEIIQERGAFEAVLAPIRASSRSFEKFRARAIKALDDVAPIFQKDGEQYKKSALEIIESQDKMDRQFQRSEQFANRLRDELDNLRAEYQNLAHDLNILNSGGAVFDEKLKISDLQGEISRVQQIVNLKHDLGLAESDPALDKRKNEQEALIRSLTREKNIRDEIVKIQEQGLDIAQALAIAQAKAAEAQKILEERDYGPNGSASNRTKTYEAMVGLKKTELDQTTAILEAEVEIDARRRRRAEREPHITKIGEGSSTVTYPALYGEDQASAATFFQQSSSRSLDSAKTAGYTEQERARQLTKQAYQESDLRKQIVEEENTKRLKSQNETDEEIKRIEDRLHSGLISNESALSLARLQAQEARRKAVQDTGNAVTLLKEKIDRLFRGDKEETAVAKNQSIEQDLSQFTSSLEKLIGLQASLEEKGGLDKYLIDPERMKLMNASFELGTYQEAINLFDNIAASQYRIAHASENAALRMADAYQKAYEQIALADDRARESQIASQVKIADQSILHTDQVRANVLDHISQYKSVTQIWSDAFISTMDKTGDAIGGLIGKVTDHLGPLGNIIKQIGTDIAKLAISRIFQRLLDAILPPSSGGGGTQSAGGSRGFSLGNIATTILGGGLGGIFRPAGSPGGGQPGFTGVGSNPLQLIGASAGSVIGGGINPFAGDLFGTGLTAPAGTTHTNTTGQLISPILQQAAGSATGATKAGFSLSSLGSSLGALAPFLGLSAGGALGGGGGLSGILGSAGGLLLGGSVAASLGLFGGAFVGGGALGIGATVAPAIGGSSLLAGIGSFLLNPFTIGAAGALLIGAFFLNRNKQRRQGEVQRAAILGDSKSKLQAILAAVNSDRMDGSEAITQAASVRADYLTQVAAIKDSKTRRIAEATVRELDVIIAQINEAVKRQDKRKDFENKFTPTFADGGRVAPQMAANYTQQAVQQDGGANSQFFSGRVPGTYDRMDDRWIRVTGDEVVLTPPMWRPIENYLRQRNVPGFGLPTRPYQTGGNNQGSGYQDGGAVFARAPLTQASGGDPIKISIGYISIDAQGIVFHGMQSSTNQAVVLDVVDKDIRINREDGVVIGGISEVKNFG